MEVLGRSPKAELKTFLTIVWITAWMQIQFGKAWEEATTIYRIEDGITVVKVKLDHSHAVGMPHVEEIFVHLKGQIYLEFHSSNPNLNGSYLMIWGYSPQVKTLFYWETEMFTVYSQGENYDPPPPSKSSRVGFLNAPSRRGSGITSSRN